MDSVGAASVRECSGNECLILSADDKTKDSFYCSVYNLGKLINSTIHLRFCRGKIYIFLLSYGNSVKSVHKP